LSLAPRTQALIWAVAPFTIGSAGFLLMSAVATTGNEGVLLLWKAGVCAGFALTTGRIVLLRTKIAKIKAECRVAKAHADKALKESADLRDELADLRGQVKRLTRAHAEQSMREAALYFGDAAAAVDTAPALPAPRLRIIPAEELSDG
jgi:hypothetical protein